VIEACHAGNGAIPVLFLRHAVRATGYPRSIGLGPGGARYAPGELDASQMIAERRADVILYVGARTSGGIKEDTDGGRRGRSGDGVIVVGPRLPAGAGRPDVWIPTDALTLRLR